MPKTVNLPITAYRISSTPAGRKWGAPAVLPLGTTHRALLSVPLDRIPRDATITAVTLRTFAERADANGGNVRVTAPLSSWKSSVVWPGPNVGAILATVTPAALADRQAIDLASASLTAWAVSRSRNGLRLESSTAWPSGLYMSGSSAAVDKPILIVTYTIPPDIPGQMVPDGGSVSVAAPILTYAGDEQMTHQKVQFSLTEGGAITYDSGFLAATTGRYDPALDPGANPVLVDGGAGIWWRVQTDGPDGASPFSEWAYYEFDSLPTGSIDSPGATSIDGSPPIEWTASAQQSFSVLFTEGSQTIDDSKWINEPATREWQPGKAIAVPGHRGKITLSIRDAITPRVEAEGAPTALILTHEFDTTLAGAETAIEDFGVAWDEPVPVLYGHVNDALSPAMIGLFRDGVQVPIWNADGDPFLWAPIDEFVDGAGDFSIRDYSSPPRFEHSWQVYVKDGGLPSALTGPAVTDKFSTKSVWVVDPRTGEQIEIVGTNGVPAIEQTTIENSILHMPINGGLIVEPKRRRLTRTTREGTAEGTVLDEHEGILLDWVEGDSGNKYRLIFGKINWSIIIGDYDPADVEAYPPGCGPNRVMVKFNWWQRLADY